MAPKPWPASILAPMPAVKVNGTEDVSFSQNLLSLTAINDSTGVRLCEAAFNDWGSPP